MTDLTDAVRAGFEEWARDRWPGWGLVRGQFGKAPEHYLTKDTQFAWEVWQAALAMLRGKP